MKRIAMIDNYDSFTYNLVHYVESVDEVILDVFYNDQVSIETLEPYDAIIFSPGPGLPSEAGKMPEIIAHFFNKKNMLGVCLGHQAIAEFMGAKLKNLNTVYHGVKTPVHIIKEGHPLFNNIPHPFQAGRYHSWVVDSDHLPDEIIINAVDSDNNIMAFQHVSLPVYGVQFHPESIMTEYGNEMIQQWIKSL
jgi:anthranilate synthase component 2